MTAPHDTESRACRVALTGGIATGKSYCLSVFRQLGAPVIDADQVARDAVARGSEGLAAIVERFGDSVLLPDGELNRAALGAIVFGDARLRQHLEGIIHPQVYAAIQRWFSQLQEPLGIADIPLLFETSHEGDFDLVIVAACRPDQQLARLMARSGLTEAEAQLRIDAQLPLAEKVAHADYVIDTGGTLEQTASRTERVWKQLKQGRGTRA